jgi:hypothetical protein
MDGVIGELLVQRFGHAEVDHLHDRLAIAHGDEDVARLQVGAITPVAVGPARGDVGESGVLPSSWE